MYERKCESLEQENLSLKLQMQALNPKQILNPNPKPQTPNPKPYTLNPKPFRSSFKCRRMPVFTYILVWYVYNDKNHVYMPSIMCC
jgi:hypothetical protein